MQQLKRLYRSTYSGENIVTGLTYEDGEWRPELELVPNAVLNTHTTTQAVAIGNGVSRLAFDLQFVINHSAGFGGRDSLQTYGCNALYRDYTPDFLVATGAGMIQEIAKSGYCANNIVYANADYLEQYPGKFYLIPQNLYFDSGAIAAYMAAFDGHKKVFLIGYDSYDVPSTYNNVYSDTANYLTSQDTQNHAFFTKSLRAVMTTYSDVEFVRVMPVDTHWAPIEHVLLTNFRQIDYRQFVLEADVGMLSSV
jgi:hypothetical protein